MSGDRGRSWRPEKRVTARQSRRKLITGLSALLIVLVGFVAFLMLGRPVPPVQFVVVTEKYFDSDPTHITQLPPGSTAINGFRLLTVAEGLHNQASSQVSNAVTFDSIAELVQAAPESENKSVIIYLTAEAMVVPTDATDTKVGVQFLSADPAKDPIPLADLLSMLRKCRSMRTLLILELTGRNPGLASGGLADEFRESIEQELYESKIPGLNVICACDKGERSWEFFEEPPVAATDDSETAVPEAAAAELELPEFDGTVFGHFLVRAFEEGKAQSTATLHQYLNQHVQEWVRSHYGCTQSVWTWPESGSIKTRQSTLIGIELQNMPVEEKSGKDADANSASELVNSKVDDSKTGEAPGASTTVSIDDRPIALLKQRLIERDTLMGGTAPVRLPAEWLRLQVSLLAAERFAMNGNEVEFRRIHDNVVKKTLNQLSNSVDAGSSDARLAIIEWLAISSGDDTSAGPSPQKQVQPLLLELNKPEKVLLLPKDLQSPGPARQAFAIELVATLKSLADSIETMSESDRVSSMQPIALLMQDLKNKGWPLNEFPEPMATVKEVLESSVPDPKAVRLEPLVRLLRVRQNVLQLAAGCGSAERQLRQATWNSADVAGQLEKILVDLNSAERWLCIGPSAVPLAQDRLKAAEDTFDSLRMTVDEYKGPSQVRDAQVTELPFLVEYLALLLESNSLPEKELDEFRGIADSEKPSGMRSDEFPIGQLEPIGFNRDHLGAMLALTRIFSAEDPVSQADRDHLNRLREFVHSRSTQTVSATERLQLLNIPQFLDRTQLFDSLQKVSADRKVISTEASSHSGIWLSFWSLRMVEAISGQSQDADWTKWKAMVKAIDEAKRSEIPPLRAEMVSTLRNRWIKAVGKLSSGNDDIFVAEKDVLDLFSKEVSRRSQTSANPQLFSAISQEIGADMSVSSANIMEVPNEATPSRDGSFEVPLMVRNVKELYVLSDSVSLLNPEKQSQHQWSFLPVTDTEGAEQTKVTVRLQTKSALSSSTKVKLVAVDRQGIAVASTDVTLLPSSDHEWRIEVVQFEESNIAGRPITLSDGATDAEKYLRLPPSTWDETQKTHAPVLLKIRLNHIKGVAGEVQVQMRPVDRQKNIWTTAKLTFPDGSSQIDIPLTSTASAAPAPPAVAPPAVTASTAFNISDGIVFDVTPLGVAQPVSTSLTVYPRLHLPEHIFEFPKPDYNHDTGVLTLRLDRRTLDNSTNIWPARFPGELLLNPAVRRYLKSSDSITPDADGFVFRAEFRSEIEQTIGDSSYEFGVSVAGVPHAWWWQLTDGSPVPVKGVRTFLDVDNFAEVIPVPDVPELLIGKDWRRSKLRPAVFLHDVAFDREQLLLLHIRAAGSDSATPIPVTKEPIPVKGRFAETVMAAPGENNVWQISTRTDPYGIPPFEPAQIGLKNGRYECKASLQMIDRSSDPEKSAVSFTLDDSEPLLDAGSIELESSPTLVTGMLKGKISAQDPESLITKIRYGLKEDLMQEFMIDPPNESVEEIFELENSLGFPEIEQSKNRAEGVGTLTVEVFNGAGLPPRKQTKQIKFYRPGTASMMKAEPKPPGSIKVTFSSSSEFIVTVSGPDGYSKESAGASSVAFDDVPAGKCSVKWKPKQGSAGGGGPVSVVVSSGKTTSIAGN